MDQEVIDERDFVSQFKSNNIEEFYRFVKQYDAYMFPIMKARGWKPVIKGERTALFTFGDVSFSRRGYKRDGIWCYPVDEKLGLLPYQRHSKELLFQLAQLSTMLPYRKVVEMVYIMYGIYINRETVRKAVKIAEDLYDERDSFRFYKDNSAHKKIDAKKIYIEGDGVLVKTTTGEKKRTDLAHFVVHTGSKKIENNRWELLNKCEIISRDYSKAKEQLLDLLYQEFEVSNDTIIITNYTPYVFSKIAKMFNVNQHFHFWDQFHLNEKIRTIFKNFDPALKEKLFEAINKHSRKTVLLVFDTAESLCETEDQTEELINFKNKLLKNFNYTMPPKTIGLTNRGIGIMESQHRKVTYRMKNRGMYWSKRGAEAMGRMILQNSNGDLRELFFGSWRDEYEHFTDAVSAKEVFPKKITGLNQDYGRTAKTSAKLRIGNSIKS